MNVMRTLPRLLTDTGQKKTPEKKDGRRMSFQRPKGTTEYSVSNEQASLLVLCSCQMFLMSFRSHAAAAASLCVSDAGGFCCALTSASNIGAVEVVFLCFEGTASHHAR